VNVFDEPKVDAHCHVLDPARFPYAPDVAYRPAGQEIGTLEQYLQVMDAYGIRHALLVGPQFRLRPGQPLHAGRAAPGNGRFRGVAVVRNDITARRAAALREAGVIGVAFNATVLGVDYYLQAGRCCGTGRPGPARVGAGGARPAAGLRAPAGASGVRMVFDHCGRPRAGGGIDQPGFQALLALARTGAPRSSCPATRSSPCSRRRTPTPGLSCARCSRPSRPTPACGRRTGPS
jgi:hypothetical protein